MKRIVSVFVVVSLLLGITGFIVHAEDAEPFELPIYINGEEISFEVQPELKNDRTFVPMRQIFEMLNAKVEYDSSTNTITAISEEGAKLTHKIGTNEIQINNSTFTFDADSYTKNSRTMVPLRFIAQSLGADVFYNTEDSNVMINNAFKKPVNIEIEKDFLNENGLYFDASNEEELEKISREVYSHLCDPNGENALPGEAKYPLESYLPYEIFKEYVRAINNVQIIYIKDNGYSNPNHYIENFNSFGFTRLEPMFFLGHIKYENGFLNYFYNNQFYDNQFLELLEPNNNYHNKIYKIWANPKERAIAKAYVDRFNEACKTLFQYYRGYYSSDGKAWMDLIFSKYDPVFEWGKEIILNNIDIDTYMGKANYNNLSNWLKILIVDGYTKSPNYYFTNDDNIEDNLYIQNESKNIKKKISEELQKNASKNGYVKD